MVYNKLKKLLDRFHASLVIRVCPSLVKLTVFWSIKSIEYRYQVFSILLSLLYKQNPQFFHYLTSLKFSHYILKDLLYYTSTI